MWYWKDVKIPWNSLFSPTCKKEKKFTPDLFSGLACTSQNGLSTSSQLRAVVPQLFSLWPSAAFIFGHHSRKVLFPSCKRCKCVSAQHPELTHRAHRPTRVLPDSREGADADATELQLIRTQQGRHSSQDELERGRGAMAFSSVKQPREWLRRAQFARLRYCLAVTKSSVRLMLLHSLTHHRKGLCTNTLKGISLSQKEHMSFVPNGNGFSAQIILW